MEMVFNVNQRIIFINVEINKYSEYSFAQNVLCNVLW